MNQQHRNLIARVAIVATLALSAVASWAVQGHLNQTPGVNLTVSR